MRLLSKAIVATALVALAAGGSSIDAGAQQWPTKPVKLVVAVPPGGGLDLTARALAPKLTQSLGQQVIVENLPGASGAIGTEAVARMPPDGYTYLITATVFLIVPRIMRNVAYDPVRDYTGISLIGWVPQIMVVNPSLPAKNVRELIALAKERPGELNYASAGNGSGAHMAMVLFNRQAGLRMTQISYKGDGPALVDLVGGHVLLKFDNMPTSIPHVRAGRLRALGVTSPNRSPLLPDVPAIGETLPGYEASIFYAMVAPAGTPKDIVARMHGEIVKFVQMQDVMDSFGQQGVQLQSSPSAQQFTDFIKSDYAKWGKLIQEAGITAE
jgi:tripartite-type tricarboxylate transporter receptor subunit TctC